MTDAREEIDRQGLVQAKNQLMGRVVALEGRFKWGTASLSFSSSTASAVTTVPHGLGGQPASVVATMIGWPGVAVRTYNWTATTFDVDGEHPSGALGGSFGFAWMAVR